MNSALLSNGQIVTANEYRPDKHGTGICCIDQTCNVPVIYVQETEDTTAHFKTSGKGNSIHKPSCGFFKKLSLQESLAKMSDYQKTFLENGMSEIVIRLNMNSIDPDYEPRVVERGEKEKKEKKDETKIKIKKESETPQSIASLKSVKKLLTSYEPDILASQHYGFG
jgi:hypothetical protein